MTMHAPQQSIPSVLQPGCRSPAHAHAHAHARTIRVSTSKPPAKSRKMLFLATRKGAMNTPTRYHQGSTDRHATREHGGLRIACASVTARPVPRLPENRQKGSVFALGVSRSSPLYSPQNSYTPISSWLTQTQQLLHVHSRTMGRQGPVSIERAQLENAATAKHSNRMIYTQVFWLT